MEATHEQQVNFLTGLMKEGRAGFGKALSAVLRPGAAKAGTKILPFGKRVGNLAQLYPWQTAGVAAGTAFAGGRVLGGGGGSKEIIKL